MNRKFLFNLKNIKALKAADKRVRYYDTKVPGFICEVLRTGKKKYRVYKKMKNVGSAITRTIGDADIIKLEDARKKAYEELMAISDGINPNQKEMIEDVELTTLVAAFQDYLETKKLTEKTVRGYKSAINTHLSDWSDIPLSEIDQDMVKNRHRLVSQTTKAQADYAFRVLRAIYNFAKINYKTKTSKTIFSDNPVNILSHLDLWNKIKSRKRFLSKQEIKVLVEQLAILREIGTRNEKSICDFLEIALYTGLRKGSILQLKWEDIDFENNCYTLKNMKGDEDEELELPITEQVLRIFKRRQKEAINDHVFCAVNNHGYVREPKKTIAKIREMVGFDFCPHDLRRTFATIAEDVDVSRYKIKRLLNHKVQRSDVTSNYTIFTAKELMRPAQIINSKIDEYIGNKQNTDAGIESVLRDLMDLPHSSREVVLSLLSKSEGLSQCAL